MKLEPDMKLINKLEKYANNLILIMLVAIGLLNATFDKFDLRSTFVGYVLNNNSKNSGNDQNASQVRLAVQKQSK